MSGAIQKFALISVATFLVAGCEGDSPVATAETIAEDSALAAQVLSAEGDNLFAVGAENPDDTIDEPLTSDVVVQQPASAPAPTPQRPVAVAVAPRQPAATVAVAASSRIAREPRVRESHRPAMTRRSAGVVSPGSSLTLVANRRACADAGNTFRATVLETVRGSNGVMIPRGAQATAEMTGADKWGAGIGVRVKSVRIGGRSYPLTSRVGYVLPDRSGCIRERGRIEVETAAPLRVVAMVQ
jgi:hypothetical protein